jgi:hypothetical protein
VTRDDLIKLAAAIAVDDAAGKVAAESDRLKSITPDDIAHWYRQHGPMHPIDTYDRAMRGEAEALRIVARDLDGGS